MNAHDLIKEAIAEKGKFDSVYWIACYAENEQAAETRVVVVSE